MEHMWKLVVASLGKGDELAAWQTGTSPKDIGAAGPACPVSGVSLKAQYKKH